MVTSAFRVPEPVGAKTTVIEQKPPGVIIPGAVGQLLFKIEKSPPSAPVIAMFEMSSGAAPVLVRIAVSGVLGRLMPWEPKLRLAGVKVTTGLRRKTVPYP